MKNIKPSVFYALMLIVVTGLFACGAKITTNVTNPQPALADAEFVLVLRQSDDFINDGIKIGAIKSVDNGFSTNCSYNEVIGKLRQQARANGANVIKITRRIPPDKKSTCERIYADIYRVPDFRKHELEIDWSEGRKLSWDDFKGSVGTIAQKVWFGAGTLCDIGYESNVLHAFAQPKFYTYAKFITFSSWVNPAKKSDSLLTHEQVHFDIVELYRRKLQAQLDSSDLKLSNAETKAREISRVISKAYHNEQAVYDEETRHGANATKQREWEERIASALAE
ncbi:DUF922 domain-containing protein [Niabella insulamsoli]|uniref:DUF922 domain-containing protein n=1 Tax=Niabella insulamsoli TaxID=3144874 RepID=UPI0031FDECCA